tara:strand:- start:133 stop:534 length:402 start_codon:yes stop_codon:yes gene_type:complete
MILLKQGETTKATFTLREKATIAAPFYLFEVISIDTKESKIFTVSDVSTNIPRYNAFNIELASDSEDLLNGIVKLPLKGFYDYVIYSQENETNLDLENVTEIVEKGKIYVDGDATKQKTIYNGDRKTRTVYGE